MIYKQHVSGLTGQVIDYYMTDPDPVTGEVGWSVDPKDGRRFRARNWIELAFRIINILIIIFGKDLKYKELK